MVSPSVVEIDTAKQLMNDGEHDFESTQSSPVPPSLFECENCGRGFKGKKGLNIHAANKVGFYKCYKHYKNLRKEAGVTEELKENKCPRVSIKVNEEIEEVEEEEAFHDDSIFYNRVFVKSEDTIVKRKGSIFDKVAMALKKKKSKK